MGLKYYIALCNNKFTEEGNKELSVLTEKMTIYI